MKDRIWLLLFIIVCTIQNSTAQIGIGTNIPDPSSILDISSSDKGILITRMTEEDRDAIFEPAKGLLLYNLTTDFIQVNIGTPSSPVWVNVTGITGPMGPNATGPIAFGLLCIATGVNSTAIGGTYNNALNLNSTTTGGTYNNASGINAATLGGATINAVGDNSVGIGGASNVSFALNSSTVGGTVNEANGVNSSVIGGTTSKATGTNSTILGGSTNLASGLNAFIAGGSVNVAQGNGSAVIAGSVNKALNSDTVVIGGSMNTASGINSSVVGGVVNTANALNAVVLGGTTNNSFGSNAGVLGGTTNNALGLNSIVLGGSTNSAIGENSIVIGGEVNFAYGNSSTVSGGFGNKAKSYGELVGGINTTNYTESSATAFVLTDRLFNIGIGVEPGATKDAFTIFKNGLAVLPNATAITIAAADSKSITNKEFTAANYSKYSTIAPLSATDPGVIGEIRMTSTYIYSCYALNTWVRFPVSW